MHQALDGVRVLDLTRALAGPYCTMMLGDMGADVIKVERPGRGDDSRSWGPPFIEGESAYFLCTNRNKRSVELDMRSDLGQEILRKLVAVSDIVVENFKTGSLEPAQSAPDLGLHHRLWTDRPGRRSPGL